MRIIVGLGNPGKNYQNTRHNAGFIFVDYLADLLQLSWKYEKKLQAKLARSEVIYQGSTEDLCLIKPETFMNLSGQAVRAALDYYYPDVLEEEPQHLVVAHDDLDLPLGEFKLQKKGPKVHNGLQSLYQHLGFDDFWHLRIGVDTREGMRTLPPADYVLMKMSPEEQKQLQESLKSAVSMILP